MTDHDIIEAAAQAMCNRHFPGKWDVNSDASHNWYRDLARSSLAAATPLIRAAAMEEAGEWQPIESAPESTKVLVGLWLSSHRWFELVAEKVPAEASNWIADSGRITLKPTHWHPLPAPPEVSP
jgi:hypothetical protein